MNNPDSESISCDGISRSEMKSNKMEWEKYKRSWDYKRIMLMSFVHAPICFIKKYIFKRF